MNDAGITFTKPFVDITVEDWDLDHVRGPFLACRAVLPGMIERRSGNIVNVSSGAANRTGPSRLPYSMTKAALDRFSLNLTEDVREHNIAVNALSLGRIATRGTAARILSGDGVPDAPPMPDVVVPSVMWLAQQDAASFTGRDRVASAVP